MTSPLNVSEFCQQVLVPVVCRWGNIMSVPELIDINDVSKFLSVLLAGVPVSLLYFLSDKTLRTWAYEMPLGDMCCTVQWVVNLDGGSLHLLLHEQHLFSFSAAVTAFRYFFLFLCVRTDKRQSVEVIVLYGVPFASAPSPCTGGAKVLNRPAYVHSLTAEHSKACVAFIRAASFLWWEPVNSNAIYTVIKSSSAGTDGQSYANTLHFAHT